MPNEILLGPIAALAGALVAIGFLAKILLDYIGYLKLNAATALDGWKTQSLANDRLADAIEKDTLATKLRDQLVAEAAKLARRTR